MVELWSYAMLCDLKISGAHTKTNPKLNELVALECWFLQAVVTEKIICNILLKFETTFKKEVS